MELRNLAIYLGLMILAVSQCSEGHSMRVQRDTASEEERQIDDDEPPRLKERVNVITQPKVYEVKAGEDVSLECQVDAKNGTEILEWYKGNNIYFMNNLKMFFDADLSRYFVSLDRKYLNIRAVQPSDAGKYKCEVVQVSPSSVEHTLVVLEPAKIVQEHSMRKQRDTEYDDWANDEASEDELQNDEDDGGSPEPPRLEERVNVITQPKVYEVKVGEDVSLECQVDTKNGTEVVMQWYKGADIYFMNMMKIFFDTDLTRYFVAPDSKNLNIKAVEPSDAGKYKCEVVQVSPSSVEHTLVVLEPAKIVRFTASNDGNVAEGEDLLLTCEAIGKPPPQILWSRTRNEQGINERLSESDGQFNHNSLFIKGVKREHAGKYYCYAINGIGKDNSQLEVFITGTPHVHILKTVVNSAIGVEALLECNIRYDANPHIRWYKDGRLIEDSNTEYIVSTRGSSSNLTVTPQKDSDFGTFTCEAENHIGKHNRSIELVQRPVVEELAAEDGRLTWTVHSHRPLHEIHAQLKPIGQKGDWKEFDIPLPSTSSHRYDLVLDLNNKQLDAGKYEAIVKVRNEHGVSDNVDPVVVEIDVQPSMSIQHASVFRGSDAGGASSMRPSCVILSSVLMYLLVRTL